MNILKTYNELLEDNKYIELPYRLIMYRISGNRYIEIVRFNRTDFDDRYDIDYSYTTGLYGKDYFETESISANKLAVKIYEMLKESDIMVSMNENYEQLIKNVFYYHRAWFLENASEMIREYDKKIKQKNFNL